MRYFKNTSWLLGERILRMGVGLFVGIWIARYLGPEQFGLLSYAQSFVFLFTAIATLGLDGIVVRELVKDESKRDILLGTAFGLKLIGAIIILPVLFLAVQFTNNDDYTNLLVFIIASATIFQSFNVIDFYYQSKVLSKYIVYANIVSLLISSLVKIALILNEAPLLYFAYVVLFDSFILACGFLSVYRYKKCFTSQWQFDTKVALSLLKDSWPLILSGVAISIALRIDQVMLKEYMSTYDVGIYSVGVRLSEVFAFIPMLISQSIFPKLVTMDFKEERKQLVILIRMVFFMLLGTAFIVSIFSEYIVLLLFGYEFAESFSVLNILIWTIPITYLGIITNKILIKENKNKIIFIKQLLLTLINIVLNIYLIPKYGVVGAALATLFADCIINFIFDVFVSQARWIFFLKLESLFYIKIKWKVF